ncbi:YfiR family protein [Pseudodesulfovibrio senegalensis]|uniref:YfiR family protein n=1 Tax=Pseudodesulfovibrio senegalensis TaxID=1721087 RepID=A0A6N6N2I0_9BACT|nr:YfiR family protein [Pseudodesulfovibrio senegalensis]KAB1442151.1 YfiR family protein [Pseudodesulfovibrio senegalensis]
MEILSRKRLPIFAVLLALTVLPVLFAPTADAGNENRQGVEMDKLRSLFIKRMTKYVSWPVEKTDKPLIVAATDAHSLRPYFEGQSSKFTLRQWPVDECDILFLNNISPQTAAAIIKKLGERPILTVGQSSKLMEMGGMVNFRESNGRLKLQINAKAVNKAKLSISSRLMSLADVYGSRNQSQSFKPEAPSNPASKMVGAPAGKRHDKHRHGPKRGPGPKKGSGSHNGTGNRGARF